MGMRVADYIANFVAEQGVSEIFMIVGGMSMHLNDAFGNHHGLNLQKKKKTREFV